MPYSVTSWFIDQTELKISSPVRKFTIGDSDYTSRVKTWPSISRTIKEFRTTNIQVPLINNDGYFNSFLTDSYKIPKTCKIQVGYNHINSGNELIDIFTGVLKEVDYDDDTCKAIIYDKIFEFSERKISDQNSQITLNNQIPSDIAWTLCTCYGQLSNVKSTSNPDINYQSFLDWSFIFSNDNILCKAYYKNATRVTEALDGLLKINGSMMFIEGDGKLNFAKFTNPNSIYYIISRDDYIHLSLNLQGKQLKNKQYVYFDYDITSQYHTKSVFFQNSTSINTFGLHEGFLKDDSVWHVNSLSAYNQAQREVFLYAYPTRKFSGKTTLKIIHSQLGESIAIFEPFFNLCFQTWRLIEYKKNLDDGSIDFIIDDELSIPAFFLDETKLDGTEILV